MKLKVDESGNAVLQDGHPIYVHDDGKEIPFDAPVAMAKIGELSKEAKKNRERADMAEANLRGYDGLDPQIARKALETVKNLDAKKLIDAGEVDKVKEEITKIYEPKLKEKDLLLQERDARIYNLMVTSRFSGSRFIQDKIVVPVRMMKDAFARYFKVEDDRVVAYLDGNKIYSRQKPGELAGFDEALEILVEAYPDKDRILKSTGASGAATPPGGGGGGAPGTIRTRADFKSDKEKSNWIDTHGMEAFKKLPAK